MKINTGKEIRDVRISLGLSQQAFAALFNATPPKRLTTHQRDISKYETGRTLCPSDKYAKFLALGKENNFARGSR